MTEKMITRVRRPVALLLALLLVVYSTPVALAAGENYSVSATVNPVDGEYGGTVQINNDEAGQTADGSFAVGESTTIKIAPLDERFEIDTVTDGENSLMSKEGYDSGNSEHVYTVSGDTTVVATFKRVAYKVETSIDEDSVGMGTVSVTSGDATERPEGFVALSGSAVVVTPTDARYDIESVVDGNTPSVDLTSKVSPDGVYEINSDTNLVVTFERIAYKVEASVTNNGGTVEFEKGETTYYTPTGDGTATLTITPETGYVVERILVGEDDKTAAYDSTTKKLELSGLSGDTNVEVTFIKTYEVKVSVAEIEDGIYGGTATINNAASDMIKEGQDAVITIAPESDDYVVDSVTVDGDAVDYDGSGSYTIENVAAAHSVVVTFVELHDLTISAAGDGDFTIVDKDGKDIALDSKTRVKNNTEIYAAIASEIGSVITSVKIDGAEKLIGDELEGLLSDELTYTVKDDTEIVVTAVERNYDVTFSIGENGGIKYTQGSGGSGDAGDVVSTAAGDDITLTITPVEGYKISKVEIDGTPTAPPSTDGAQLEITLEDINKAAQVKVEFAPRVFNVGITYGENGTATINNGSSADLAFATDAVVVIKPDVGYEVDTITVDDVPVSGLAGYDPVAGTFTHRIESAKDIEIDVTFKLKVYPVSATVANGVGGTAAMTDGSENMIPITEAKHFSKAAVVITPAYGYRVSGVSLNGEAVDFSDAATDYVENDDNTSVYTFTVDCETVVVVSFEPLPTVAPAAGYTLLPSVGSEVLDASAPDSAAEYRYFSNDAEMQLRSGEGYNRIRVKYSGSSEFTDWIYSIDFDTSCIITEMEVKTVEGFNAAKVAMPKQLAVVKDTDAPSVSVSVSNKWVDGLVAEVTLGGDASDAPSTAAGIPASGVKRVVWSTTELDAAGVTASTNEATLLADGSYSFTAPYAEQFYIYSQDYAGNVSTAATVTVPRDGNAPQATAFAFSSEADINYMDPATVSRSEMTLTVTVSDPGDSSGLDEIALYYREPGTTAGTLIETQSLAGSTAQFTLAAEIFASEKEIYVVVTDNVGNSSGEVLPTSTGVTSEALGNSVIIDSTGPSVSISGGGSGWVNNSVTFSISASDADSGLESVTIRVNGSQTSGGNYSDIAPSESTSRSFSVTASQAGSNSVTVEVRNKAGLTASASASVNIDQSAPTITGFEFAKAETSAAESVFNFLTFGLFTNDKVDVTVTAEDSGDSSGVNSITLYIDGEEFETKPAAGGSATFTIPAAAIVDGELLFNQVISATADDNAGNDMNDAVAADETNSNMQGDGLMVETVVPEIAVVVSDPVEDMNALTAAEGNWYAGDAEFDVTFSDEHSGINNVEITVNGESLDDDTGGNAIDEAFGERDEKLVEQTFSVSTAQGEISEDGSYTVTASMVDNAGNESEVYTHTVYKDVSVPEIIGFDFEPEQYVEGAEDVVQIEATEYGFYFREDTRVTVSSFDAAPSSGVKSITYYLVDVEGGSTEEVTAEVDADGKISFVVEADFKGQIFAKATDNVLNTPADFVSPDRAILETPEMHSRETHIALVKGNATYVTDDGSEFYAGDVPVTVTITDTYSGLRSIEWSVSAPYDTALNDSGTVVFANDGSLVAGSDTGWTQIDGEANLVTEISRTIPVTHNSNDIVLRVSMTDRAGNTSSDEITFSIDKVMPVIEVEYDNNAPDAEYTDVYDAARVATITVTERNFDPGRISVEVTNSDGEAPALSGWTEYRDTVNPDASYYTATISYLTDGDYTFAIAGSDMAENAAPAVESDAFTVDTTAPVVSVSYANDAAAEEDGEPADGFFNVYRTATIVITEHNFDPARAVISGTASDVDNPIFPTASAWSTVGDVHTATIRYGADGRYVFDIAVNDMAGTPIADYAGDEFVIDTTAPELEIAGVTDRTAYSDEVMPEIIYSDINLDAATVSITLTGVNTGAVDYSFVDDNISGGIHRIYDDFEHIKEVDDIYTLTVTLSDLAGNGAEMTVTFSVNRYGSTYDVSEVSELSGRYLQSVGDLVFTEVNVTPLDQDAISIRLTKNGVPVDLVNGVDFFVEESGGDGEWSVYTYRINEELFADNGTYSLAVYSVDEAGNINENIDESKEAEIVFGIDKTAPIVVSIDLESDTQYAVETKNVSATITDNLVLDSVVIFLNDVEVQYVVNGSAYSFDIPESTELQTVRIVASDAAGNMFEQVIEDVLVSTSMFVRWYSNTSLFVGTLVGAGVVIAGGTAGIALGVSRAKRKREQGE